VDEAMRNLSKNHSFTGKVLEVSKSNYDGCTNLQTSPQQLGRVIEIIFSFLQILFFFLSFQVLIFQVNTQWQVASHKIYEQV
jgi:hypothetical protein